MQVELQIIAARVGGVHIAIRLGSVYGMSRVLAMATYRHFRTLPGHDYLGRMRGGAAELTGNETGAGEEMGEVWLVAGERDAGDTNRELGCGHDGDALCGDCEEMVVRGDLTHGAGRQKTDRERLPLHL